MTRDLKLGAAGILFYLIIAMNLLITKSSQDFLRNLASKSSAGDPYQGLTAILGLGALLFTSDAMGYLFSTIHIFFWNWSLWPRRESGYSGEWKKQLAYDVKDRAIERYQVISKSTQADPRASQGVSRWRKYGTDVFFSYFWQRAPEEIVDWVARRYKAFDAGMSTVIGIVLAIILSWIIIWTNSMESITTNWIITGISLVVAFVVFCNAQHAKNEGWQMIDLWLTHVFDATAAEVLNCIQAQITTISEKTPIAKGQN